MNRMFFSLLILIALGLLCAFASLTGAPHNVALAVVFSGSAVAVAILMLGLVHLRIHEQKLALWPNDHDKE